MVGGSGISACQLRDVLAEWGATQHRQAAEGSVRLPLVDHPLQRLYPARAKYHHCIMSTFRDCPSLRRGANGIDCSFTLQKNAYRNAADFNIPRKHGDYLAPKLLHGFKNR
jgi:hypothetical protein